MEFGTLIPLYFLTMCCFIATPIAGFSSLAFIRYSLKDKGLAKNILLTIGVVALLAFLYPLVGLIRGLILLPLCCPEIAALLEAQAVREMTSISVKYALFLIIPSLTVGFLIALFFTVPITFLARYAKKKKEVPDTAA
jgi:hypothetical protein